MAAGLVYGILHCPADGVPTSSVLSSSLVRGARGGRQGRVSCPVKALAG